MGPEEISRVTRFPVFFIEMRRTPPRALRDGVSAARHPGKEKLKPGEITERYARLVETQIRAAPPDWPWSHKRWKLKKSVYKR